MRFQEVGDLRINIFCLVREEKNIRLRDRMYLEDSSLWLPVGNNDRCARAQLLGHLEVVCLATREGHHWDRPSIPYIPAGIAYTMTSEPLKLLTSWFWVVVFGRRDAPFGAEIGQSRR